MILQICEMDILESNFPHIESLYTYPKTQLSLNNYSRENENEIIEISSLSVGWEFPLETKSKLQEWIEGRGG